MMTLSEYDQTVVTAAERQMTLHNLRMAIMEKDDAALYACLQKTREPFNEYDSYSLCKDVLESQWSLQVFQAILEHCEPLETFCFYPLHNYVTPFGTGGLVQEAAANDCPEILQYLLDQGFSPNRKSQSESSALEAALWRGSVRCVELLCKREDVDTSVTENLRCVWGRLGVYPQAEAGYRIAARRILGYSEEGPRRDVPLLPGFRISHAVKCENFTLIERLLRDTTVTVNQGKEILELLLCYAEDIPFCARWLDKLFAACPALLRNQTARGMLALCMLGCEDESEEQLLRPWVDKLPGREIVLTFQVISSFEAVLGLHLCRWEDRLGSRFYPSLRRNEPLSDSTLWGMPWEDVAYIMLTRCKIRNDAPKGEVSRLAKQILKSVSPGLVAELCDQGILFPQENLEALLEYCGGVKDGKTKRNILLVYMKKDVFYEL